MRVLLTGSTGFIGSAVSTALQERGDEVIAAVRANPRRGDAVIDVNNGVIDAGRLPGGTLEGIDAAVHLAGAPIIGRWTSQRREDIRASRIAVGDLLARTIAQLRDPPAVLVGGSAIGYYGNGGEAELDESSGNGQGFLADVCRAWESSASPASEAGIRTVLIRTGVVLGAGGALAPQLRLFRLGLGGRLGSGKQWLGWVALADEVGAILRAIDDPTLHGPVNATSPTPVRNSEFTAALAAATGHRAPFVVPGLALRLAFGGPPVDEMLLASQRVIPRKLMASGFAFKHPVLADALAVAIDAGNAS